MAKPEQERTGLSPQRVETILQAYGARPEAWPSGEREAVRAYLQQHEPMRVLAEQEASLDALLAMAPVPEPQASLRAHILLRAPQPPLAWWERVDSWAAGLWPLGRSWQPIGALAIAGLLGVGIGIFGQGLVLDSTVQSQSADALDLALGDTSGFGEWP